MKLQKWMSLTDGSMWRSFLVLVFVAIAVRVAFICIVPSPEAPDEYHHLFVIQFIRDNLRLPDPQAVAAGGKYGVYGSMPPLGYSAHILISRLFPTDHIIFFARFGSLVMGVFTLWAAWRAGKEIFAGRPLLSLALPWTIVFHPQFVFLNSYLNSDSAAAAVSAWIMYLLVLSMKRGPTIKRCAFIGALLGLLVLCKYNGLALIPVAVLSVVAAVWLHCLTIAYGLQCLMVMGVAAIAASAWWFVRNYYVFSGDILGVNTGYKVFAANFDQPMEYKKPFFELLLSKRWWRFIFFSYWGLFGHMTRWMWRPTYFIYLSWLILSLVGWLKTKLLFPQIFASDIETGSGSDRPKVRADLVEPFVWMMLALCALTNLAAVLASQLGGPQGRYFFISEIALIALLLEGLWRLGPQWGKRSIIAFLVFNAVVCLGAWVMLLRIYGVPAQLP